MYSRSIGNQTGAFMTPQKIANTF